jgi:hypothetical protein
MLRRFPIESKGRRKKLREVCLHDLGSALSLIWLHGRRSLNCFFLSGSTYLPYKKMGIIL